MTGHAYKKEKDENKKLQFDGATFSVEIDEGGLRGLSALLTCVPSAGPLPRQGEQRKGQDRRSGDRRTTAREFSVPE